MASAIERFGYKAVVDRPLGVREIRRIMAAEQVTQAYHSRGQSGNWAEWADANPRHARLLAQAAKAAEME